MIQIQKNSKVANQFGHKIVISGGMHSLKSKINHWLINNSADPNRNVIEFIKTNLFDLIVSEPKKLISITQSFDSKGYNKIILDKKGNLTGVGKSIEKLFGYDNFRQSKKAIWLYEKLNIKTCSYCNTQYTLLVKDKSNEKLSFQFDHFFPKSYFPYLSLSFYNLIPSCSTCNQGKSSKVYTLDDSIHPYEESFHDMAFFKAENASLLNYLLTPRQEDLIKLEIKLRSKFIGDKKVIKKVNNFKNEFKLEPLYENFKDVVGETYLKAAYYNSARRKEIIDFFKSTHGLTIDDSLIDRFIVGNYVEDKDLNKRPLSKLMKDISQDFRLIK